MNILRLRHAWPENSGFSVHHASKRSDYIFIHFHTPVTLYIHGEKLNLRSHALAFFGKDTEFSFYTEGALVHDWIHIEGDVSKLLSTYALEEDRIYYPKSYDFITDITRELEAEFFSSKSFFRDIYDAKLTELCIKIARSTVLEESTEQIPDGIVKSFVNLRKEVFESLNYPWTVSCMAKKVLLSESRFYVVYKEIFGISPKNDLICARIELAKNLLRRGTYSVREVASMSGYTGTFNFIKQFKRAAGMTPGQFRYNSDNASSHFTVNNSYNDI